MTPHGPDARSRVDGLDNAAGTLTDDHASLWTGQPGGAPSWERDLDALVAPALFVEPPAAVQQAILAAVLAAATPVRQPVMFPLTPALTAPTAPARPLPLAAYLLVAGVLVAYVAAMSWVQGAFGGSAWLSTLFAQLLAVSELVVGRPVVGEPLSVAWLLLQRAPWLLLLPIGWLLWERDRSSARVA